MNKNKQRNPVDFTKVKKANKTDTAVLAPVKPSHNELANQLLYLERQEDSGAVQLDLFNTDSKSGSNFSLPPIKSKNAVSSQNIHKDNIAQVLVTKPPKVPLK